jgi:ABC-type phosphate transport system substrate-binding protein
MTKTKLLMGASALVASLALAGAGGAATVTYLYGTGSSLDAPYLAEIEGCYGPQQPLDIQGATVTTKGTTATYKVCLAPSQTAHALKFMQSSSGFGEGAVFSNNAKNFAGLTSANTTYPGLEYGAGDYGLGGDVTKYNCVTPTDPSPATTCSVGSGASLVTVESHGVAGGATAAPYNNPLDTYGQVIQFPLLITPVAIAYNPIYKSVYNPSTGKATSYSFNIHTKNADGSGGLQLDMPTLCAIFNGQITNWNDPAITALNGGVSLKATTDTGAFSAQIEMVGRQDGSGTTSIFYRALAAQCGQGTVSYTEAGDSLSYTNAYLPAGGKNLPSSLGGASTTQYWTSGATLTPVLGQFTLAKGSGGIAAYMSIALTATAAKPTLTQGKIAYIGPDFALPACKNTKTAGCTSLNVVDIKTNGVAIEPTAATALAAFSAAGGANGLLPPQTDVNGAYDAANTTFGARSAPQDWAEPLTTTVTYSTGGSGATPLAAPPAGYYPIVGTSNFFFYTCYKTAQAASDVTAFLNYYYTNAQTKTVLNLAGLAQMPSVWGSTILGTFVTDPNSLSLNITTGGTGPQCTGHTGAI